MDLYSITIMFKNGANAQDAFDAFDQKAVIGAYVATDDYGKKCIVRYEDYAAIAFAHTNNELNAAQDEQILQAHAQIQLGKRAKADPILSAASREPAIISPAGGPFANGQMRQ